MRMTLPPPPPGVHLTPLLLFYTINFGVVILVVIGGGRYLLWLWDHGRFPPPASPPIWGRRILTTGLGGLWLLDALLQFQPLMVTQFVSGMLAPLRVHQPAAIVSGLNVGMHLWGLNPAVSDVLAAWLQMIIGLLIVLGGETGWRRTGLWLSVGWGLVVWVLGEGLGGVLTGGGWLSGIPGSALLYVVASLMVLAPIAWWQSDRIVAVWWRVLGGLFLLAAILQAWPPAGWWTSQLGRYLLVTARTPQPAWVSAPIFAWARSALAHPAVWNAVLVALFTALAIAWTLPIEPNHQLGRVRWWATVVVGFITWWLGQDFGILGGMGTDPNTGGILLLLLVAYGFQVGLFGPGRRRDAEPNQPQPAEAGGRARPRSSA